MADEADLAQERMEREEALAAPRAPYVLPAGVAGDCNGCGEPSGRLVAGLCAHCREPHPSRRIMNGSW